MNVADHAAGQPTPAADPPPPAKLAFAPRLSCSEAIPPSPGLASKLFSSFLRPTRNRGSSASDQPVVPGNRRLPGGPYDLRRSEHGESFERSP